MMGEAEKNTQMIYGAVVTLKPTTLFALRRRSRLLRAELPLSLHACSHPAEDCSYRGISFKCMKKFDAHLNKKVCKNETLPSFLTQYPVHVVELARHTCYVNKKQTVSR